MSIYHLIAKTPLCMHKGGCKVQKTDINGRFYGKQHVNSSFSLTSAFKCG
ncbi:hypothetical protein P3J6_121111 [Pseudoalteromonas sp. 3J6]|nr:hypothetical protein P3J6_121111 [Pseudoalteromonas sp. 3J6]